MEELTQNKEPIRDYSKDKNGWVVYKNHLKGKVKLRSFIRARAQDLVFLDSYENMSEAREKLIEQYEKGGVNAVDEFVNLEFIKEVDITFEEMKELEKSLNESDAEKKKK